MAERLYHEEGTNRFVEVSSALQSEIVEFAMQEDLTLGEASAQYLPRVLRGETNGDEDTDDSDD